MLNQGFLRSEDRSFEIILLRMIFFIDSGNSTWRRILIVNIIWIEFDFGLRNVDNLFVLVGVKSLERYLFLGLLFRMLIISLCGWIDGYIERKVVAIPNLGQGRYFYFNILFYWIFFLPHLRIKNVSFGLKNDVALSQILPHF